MSDAIVGFDMKEHERGFLLAHCASVFEDHIELEIP